VTASSPAFDCIANRGCLDWPPIMNTLVATLRRLYRLIWERLGCAHERLVFDEVNDLHCAHCRKDFTG